MANSKENRNLRTYALAILFSTGAAVAVLQLHGILPDDSVMAAGLLAILFLGAFLAGRKSYRIPQQGPSTPPRQPAADKTGEAQIPSSPTEDKPTPEPHETTGQEPQEIHALFLTSDTSDRHQVLKYLAGWKITATVCNNTVRAFAEIMSAPTNGTPCNKLIVDPHRLDMDPVQLANSIRSEPSLQHLPLIYLGPENSPERDRQLTAAGYSCILQTPVNKSLLYNALHTTIDADQHHFDNVTSFIRHYTREQSSLPPLDILVAANPEHLKPIQQILKTTGHQVFTVENGEQALDALDSHNFDLAIFELEMPVMNGIEAIELYQFTHQNDPWMPLMLFIPESGSRIINECSNLNIAAALIGEVQHHTLLATIRQAIGNRDKSRHEQKTKTGEQNQRHGAILGHAILHDLEELGSGQEFVHNLINSFLGNSEELLQGMQQAIAENRHTSFIDYALAFKDSAGNLGALAVYKASNKASQLEAADFKEHAGIHLDEIRRSFNKTRKALLDYIARQHGSMHSS